MYDQALPEIRAAEAEVGAPRRLIFIEPGILWNVAPHPMPPFAFDDQIVYAPHLYIERDQFDSYYDAALSDAALLGGAPVLIGEWGGDPRRAEDPGDAYFHDHQAYQDARRFGATLWTWREACGDPHKAGDARAGLVPYVWGEFELDCASNSVSGVRALVEQLRRPWVRAAPGRLAAMSVDVATGALDAAGEDAAPGAGLVAFLPGAQPAPAVQATGLAGCHTQATPGGGTWLLCTATGGAWSLGVK
jgi:endoglycosylceramidase